MEQELPYRRQKTPRMRREAAFGVFCLTTVYPTDTHGAHGNSGERKAGKDVFGSGKGRKRLKTSGNRYSQILWEQDAAGSNPVTPTSRQCLHPILGCSYCLLFVYRAAECFVSHSNIIRICFHQSQSLRDLSRRLLYSPIWISPSLSAKGSHYRNMAVSFLLH